MAISFIFLFIVRGVTNIIYAGYAIGIALAGLPTTGGASDEETITTDTGASANSAIAQAGATAAVTVIEAVSTSAFAMTGTAAQQQTPAAL